MMGAVGAGVSPELGMALNPSCEELLLERREAVTPTLPAVG